MRWAECVVSVPPGVTPLPLLAAPPGLITTPAPPLPLRSGWQPPQDCGLWQVSGRLRAQVLESLSPASRSYWEAECAYFDQITAISGAG